MEGRATAGHAQFEAWLIARYGGSTRRPGRPHFRGLVAAREGIASELQRLTADLGAREIRPPKSAIALYHWLASAKPSARKTPRREIRIAIELVTGGAVPRDAWDTVLEHPAAGVA